MTRLKEKYSKEGVGANYKNIMAVPKIQKIVVNMGLGEATANAKIIETGAGRAARITGQKPVTRRSKKSISLCNSKCAARWMDRGEFLDRLVSIACGCAISRGVSPWDSHPTRWTSCCSRN